MSPRKKNTPASPAQPAVGAPAPQAFASELFSVGHVPRVELSEQQQQLFRSFQSNLVSLLSHELRTPLMGILNALSAIDDQGEPLGGLSRAEALSMARSQASNLESALSTVLDLAAWEAGSLKVELREGDFAAVADAVFGLESVPSSLKLVDLGRARRALERLKVLLGSIGRLKVIWGQMPGAAANGAAANGAAAKGAAGTALEFQVALADEATGSLWDVLWHEAQVARAAHASLPLHVFAGVLQSEQGFLSRTREGLGAELHLVAQVFGQHEARFEAERRGLALTLRLSLPEISGRNRILQVIRSRIWRPGLAEPAKLAVGVHRKRPAPAALAPGHACYALGDAAGHWVELGPAGPGASGGKHPAQGWASCPEDGMDAAGILDAALGRLGQG